MRALLLLLLLAVAAVSRGAPIVCAGESEAVWYAHALCHAEDVCRFIVHPLYVEPRDTTRNGTGPAPPPLTQLYARALGVVRPWPALVAGDNETTTTVAVSPATRTWSSAWLTSEANRDSTIWWLADGRHDVPTNCNVPTNLTQHVPDAAELAVVRHMVAAQIAHSGVHSSSPHCIDANAEAILVGNATVHCLCMAGRTCHTLATADGDHGSARTTTDGGAVAAPTTNTEWFLIITTAAIFATALALFVYGVYVLRRVETMAAERHHYRPI